VVATGLQSEEQARTLGQSLLEAFQPPFELSCGTWALGLTMGYVVAPADGRHAAELLKLADAAMYAGKQEGKGRLRRAQVSAAALISAL
jgi:GGDEF domain-containing protein